MTFFNDLILCKLNWYYIVGLLGLVSIVLVVAKFDSSDLG